MLRKLLPVNNPFGAQVYHEETVSSTMEAARILAGQNKAHGTVICADFQEAGRGRLKRTWAAERGKNLLFTVLLRFGSISSIPQALTLKAGLAVSLAVEDFAPALQGAVKVKWPNDIMICPRETEAYKTAGILSETDGKTVYIGVGVNVEQQDFPEECRSKAGSIIRAFSALPENARFALLEKILVRLHAELENPQPPSSAAFWRERLTQRLYKKGETVRFAPGAADSCLLVEGTLCGLGPGGELLIIPNGEKTERAFITGELQVY